MNRAFIFDMDGVLVDSEHEWQPIEKPMLIRILGKDIAEKIGGTTGSNVRSVCNIVRGLGSPVSNREIIEAYNNLAVEVYKNARITSGIEVLIDFLVEIGFKIGLVSQSPQNWIDKVLTRLPFAAKFEKTLSIFERPDIEPKPSPAGYQEMLRKFDAEPQQSIILEDSNFGIQAAKAAGAYVIGLRANLVADYPQTGADAYANSMDEVIRLVDLFDSNRFR